MMSRPTSLNAAKLRDETVAWGVCGWGSYETTLLPSVSSSIAAGEEWRHRQTTHTRRHSDHHCPEGWQCRASAPSLRSRASTPSLRSPTLIKRRFGQLGTKPSQSQQPAHASSDSAQLFRSHVCAACARSRPGHACCESSCRDTWRVVLGAQAPAYLRGLSRQLSSEELRAGRVGSQVHPQPWFRGADGRTSAGSKRGSQQHSDGSPGFLEEGPGRAYPRRSAASGRSPPGSRRGCRTARLSQRSRMFTVDQCW